MRTTTFFTGLFVSLSLCLSAQQLPNSGFENWSHKIISEPVGFFTSNAMVSSGSGSVTNIPDAYHGLAAVKLETLLSGKDTVQGLLIIGTPGDHGINGGIPFTGTPDSITGYVKYNIMPTDTASFIVAFKKNGNYLSQARTIFTGSQNIYKRFSIPTYLSAGNPPDSLVSIITSSRMDPPRLAGSTITIDSISFLHSTQQFPNNDFENWTTLNSAEDPVSWGTYAGQFPTYNLPILVTKTTDAHSGTYALKLVSDTGYAQPPFGSGKYGDTIVGMLQLNMINGFSSTKYPFAYKPDSLVGYVKGNVALEADNSNLIWVKFTKNGTEIGEAAYSMYASINEYTRFATPIHYSSSLIPDSLAIIIFTGNPGAKHVPGNVFFVDDLLFIYNPIITGNLVGKSSIELYPNPVRDKLTIVQQNTDGKYIQIYNSNGLLVKDVVILNNRTSIDIIEFSAGLYLYQIADQSGILLKCGKFVKE